jgi:hypothetical protein
MQHETAESASALSHGLPAYLIIYGVMAVVGSFVAYALLMYFISQSL